MLGGDGRLAVKRTGRRDSTPVADFRANTGEMRGIEVRPAGCAPWSDRSNLVCPVIAVFMEAWHEGLPVDERAILVPLVAKIVRSHAAPRIEQARALMAADWLVRTFAPVWLNLAGLREQARLLYGLPPVTAAAQALDMRAVLAQVSHFANAEALHVNEAGWIKASDDCWASGWAAAYEASCFAAHDPAWVSAAAASRAAAGLAARTKTQPFKVALQASAAELVVKMARLGSRPGI